MKKLYRESHVKNELESEADRQEVKSSIRLSQLEPGDSGSITGFQKDCKVKKRLRDMGIVTGCKIECIGISPLGDPAAYWMKGTALALRRQDADGIMVSLTDRNF